jgi:tetratricopeptide (TPR) repeat protein
MKSLMNLARASAAPKTLSLLAAAAALALPLHAQQDTVTLKDGKAETGRVKSADYEGVTIEAKNNARTIEWSQVASVTFKDPPEDYVTGREAFDGSRWDDAIAAFEKLKGDSKLRAPIRQDALWFSAAAQLAKGNWDAAIASLDAVRKDFPKSRYLMEVGEGYVTAYTAKKDYAGAQRALDTMSNEAVTQGVPASFGATISLLKGRLLEDQGKIAEAAASYGVAEKASGVSLIVQQQARLGQGRVLVAQKKFSDAEAIFRKLAAEDASSLVLAGAWNGLGDVWSQDAKSKADAEQIEKLYDAAFAYMRGIAQYGPGPGESPVEYKRSLEGAAAAFRGLSQVEKNADRKAIYKRRYEERQEHLARVFAGAK